MGFKLDGLDEFREAFGRLRDGSQSAVDDAVRDHMEHDVLPATQIRVPVMTGRLKATGHVEPGPGPHDYSVWYGDSSVDDDSMVDYAAAVHNREARHAPPTGTGYVQEPLEESVPRLVQKAARALEDLAGG